MDTYEEGYSDGYAEGFDKGAEEGFMEGLAEGDSSGFFNWVAFGALSGIFLAHSGFSAGSILLVGALSLAAVVAPLVDYTPPGRLLHGDAQPAQPGARDRVVGRSVGP